MEVVPSSKIPTAHLIRRAIETHCGSIAYPPGFSDMNVGQILCLSTPQTFTINPTRFSLAPSFANGTGAL